MQSKTKVILNIIDIQIETLDSNGEKILGFFSIIKYLKE